jgi:beta-glucosidase
MTHSPFPAGFLWGAATSAYQIEGAPLADGAGPSIWHRFTHTPGHVAEDATGDVACEHYRRWADDVDLVASLGLGAYRFSVSWSRVFPDGTGRVNAAGLGFYERLVDALLARGIRPSVTLYHWDLPAALDDRGGWLNPDVAHWFADYARTLYRALGDRVPLWATLNEPWVVMHEGYMTGGHAPGHRNWFEAPRVARNLLRAHGAAVQAFRADGGSGKGEIGLVANLEPKYAATQSAADLAACGRAEAYMNRHFLDPVFHGRWPEELPEIFGEAWPDDMDADMALIREPIDWLGINYYTRAVVRNDPTARPVREGRVRQERTVYTDMGWEVWPQSLADVLLWVQQRYGDPARRAGRPLPLYVTENGAAFFDEPTAEDGEVDDPLRVAYYREHLRAAAHAIREGVDLRGYFAWSLLDNFEWGFGYSRRFGIVHVDFATQERTPKTSAKFYAQVVRTNGAVLEGR